MYVYKWKDCLPVLDNFNLPIRIYLYYYKYHNYKFIILILLHTDFLVQQNIYKLNKYLLVIRANETRLPVIFFDCENNCFILKPFLLLIFSGE